MIFCASISSGVFLAWAGGCSVVLSCQGSRARLASKLTRRGDRQWICRRGEHTLNSLDCWRIGVRFLHQG
ncbi:hypothetical protein PR003_g23951 [Phytophthora rubi]|uniref:Secreted protein n=1 Tax=Phytophthora rubi TaxID=129364 RepID=A0A6A3IRA1_9STRA|nr:hypothetical protein PR002_g23304 [Phytophthora rubi]KAE9295673.1 hypothetical protein PR003_g23951 [Phytophthora rubi]